MKLIIKTTLLFVCLAMVACGVSKQSSSMLNYGSPNTDQTVLNNNTFKISDYSNDSTYGYTEKNPIMVGSRGGGPANERRFLSSLMGANGEAITFSRLGSCCGFKTKNGLSGDVGLLDKYEVAHKGLNEPIILYINMYDSDILKIPVGFKKKK